MTDTAHRTTYRKDSAPPDYVVDTVYLRFELGEETTLVQSRLFMRENYDASRGRRPLVLDGHRFVLRAVSLDGRTLASAQYTADAERLVIPEAPPA
ncbi:MAG: aminopeptidase N, partial [Geobacter sp.]